VIGEEVTGGGDCSADYEVMVTVMVMVARGSCGHME
jgi:hypothetical protein